MKWVVSIIVLLCWSATAGEVLVLKNGKKVSLDGSYEIKGAFVVFKTNGGELSQLPVKIIDFDRSKEATEEENRRLAAMAEALKPKKEKPKPDTLAEIADYVEANRGLDNPPASNIRIEADGLEKFSDNYPRPQNTDAGVEYELSGEHSAENIHAKRDEFGQQYHNLQTELSNMDKQIAEMEEHVNALASESAFGDEPTGAFYDRMEQEQAKLAQLKKDREAKQGELASVKKSARQVGVGNVKNFRAPEDPKTKKKVQTRSSKILEENRKRKGEKYDPDDEEGDQ